MTKAPKATRIPDDVLAELSAAAVSGDALTLAGTLRADVYKAVAKVIEAAGGKWDRKRKCHVFAAGDAAAAIEPVIETGEYVRPADMGQFDSPPAVVDALVKAARLEPRHSVLEPSAGVGNVVRAILAADCAVTAVEIDGRRLDVLNREFQGRAMIFSGDFLKFPPPANLFDRVVINPPFAGRADIHHVRHAHAFLKPGGRLAAVMSAGVTFRKDRPTAEFTDHLAAHCNRVTMEPLPDGSFKDAGTGVRTVILSYTKKG